jgi:endonuclease YncB( thermonuclease family)
MTVEQMRVDYTPDGDTIKVFRTLGSSAEEVRIRLAYIDAPELTNPACTAYAVSVSARAYLRRLLALREAINVTVLGQ